MKTKLIAILILPFIITLVSCSQNSAEIVEEEKIELTISAAASLNEALLEIKGKYEQEYENIDLLFNFGGSGSLAQQIAQGAPVDLFISAAKNKFVELVDDGLIDQNHMNDFLGNRLVLITPKGSEAKIKTLSDLLSDEIELIGIGTPETVPAGLYAKQAFENSNLWGSLEEKIIPAKDVRQVLSYVETNNVDAGIVYKTDAVMSEKISIVSPIESQLHDPIIYPMGIVDGTKHQEEAIDFFQFLQSEPALETFEKFGFVIVGR